MTEQELIRRCRKQDREAQRELYARTSERIYRLLLRMTGDADQAFDLAQEVYLKVFANLHRFEGGSGVSTWIYRIAINEARQALRSDRRYDARLKSVVPASASADESDRVGAEMDVREALAHLPEYERTLIVLRHLDELSYDEMADALEKPAGTIASALNRARRMLRDLLEPRPGKTREDSRSSRHLRG